MKIEFTIPGFAVPKGRPKLSTVNGMAMAYTPAKTRNYESLVRLACEKAMGATPPLNAPLSMEVMVRIGVPESWSQKRRRAAIDGEVLPTKRPDLDNYIKAILDGMNGVAFMDDARVVDLVVRKRYSETPGVSVALSLLEGACA